LDAKTTPQGVTIARDFTDSLPPELIDAYYLAKPTGEDDILRMAAVAFRSEQST
jgi:hypothetical protein